MSRSAIAAALVRLARRIGRWLLRRLVEFAAEHVVGYLLGKVEDFRRRLARAKTDRRRAWLRGRIRRWTAAAKWIADHHESLGSEVARTADELATAAGVPMVAQEESDRG